MTQNEISLLREVQRNTEMAMLAISTIADKVEDDRVSYQLERQNLVFSDLHNHACSHLVEAKCKPAPENALQDFMLKSGIHMNTLMDCSTSHIAELMIRNSTKGVTNVCKEINKQKNVKYFPKEDKMRSAAYEIAQELIAFEENCIEKWKDFL